MSKTIKKTSVLELADERVELSAIAVAKIISIMARNQGLFSAISDALQGDLTAFEVFEDMTENVMNELIDASAGWNPGRAESLDIDAADRLLAALTAFDLTVPEEEKKIQAFKNVLGSLLRKMEIAFPTAGASSSTF